MFTFPTTLTKLVSCVQSVFPLKTYWQISITASSARTKVPEIQKTTETLSGSHFYDPVDLKHAQLVRRRRKRRGSFSDQDGRSLEMDNGALINADKQGALRGRRRRKRKGKGED